MLNTVRTKALIVFVLFAGLAIAGFGLLHTPDNGVQFSESSSANESNAPENGASTSGSGLETGTEGESGALQGENRQGPPPLFPDLENEAISLQAYTQAFTALYKQSPDQFRERALQALDGPYPLEAKQAALRVWYVWNYEDRVSPFRKILVGVPEEDGSVGKPDPEMAPFALDLLAKDAHAAPKAREVLEEYIESKPLDATLRKQAWSSVLRWGKIKEVHRSLPSLYAERDRDCLEAAGQALHETSESGSKLILEELSKRHPERAARKQFKKLLSQS